MKDKFKKSTYKGNAYANFSIEIYLGEVRSGKTLTMIAETYEQIKYSPLKIKLFSNINLNKEYFPNYEKIGYQDLIKFHENKETFKNCIFLIDELHIFADSRRFMKKNNQSIGYFIGQMGKRGNTLRGNTHFMSLIDYRVRMYAERIIYITKGLVEKGIWYPILNNNRILTQEENETLCIKSEGVIRKLIGFDFRHVPDGTTFVMAKKYFDLYNTEELVTLDETEDN